MSPSQAHAKNYQSLPQCLQKNLQEQEAAQELAQQNPTIETKSIKNFAYNNL